MQPNGSDSTIMSIKAAEVKDKLNWVWSTRLTEENARSRNMPFSQKPTCQPLVLNRVLMMNMFRIPIIMGCTMYVINSRKIKPRGGM